MRPAANRIFRPNGKTHRKRNKCNLLKAKGKVSKRATEYMSNLGLKSNIFNDVQRKGGGHDPDQAPKRLS